MNKVNIILIGFMGSGKSSLGKWMSANAGFGFLDTDEYIEEKEKRTINEIFAADGEEYFRNLETGTVRELTGELENTVISVGGGLPIREENQVNLKKLGKVIYLRAKPETLIERLKGDESRPLLKGGNLEDKINSLMSARSEIYEKAADIIVDTDGLTLEYIYNDIENKLITLL